MLDNGNDSPGVIALPPLIVALFLAGAAVLEWLIPVAVIPDAAQYPIGIVAVLAGIAIMPPVLARFRKAGTPLDVRKPTTAILADGPYRFSRNPVYVSMLLAYLGIGVLVDGLWILLLAIPLAVVIDHGVIRREERYLEDRFGEEYLRYKLSVRRWQ